jgi:tetratricopeptide (TPR) repeat protein
MERFDENDWQEGVDLISAAYDALACGDLPAAHELARWAERMLAGVVGRSHPDFAGVKVSQGMLASATGLPREAIIHYREALAIYERHRGDPQDAAIVRPLRAQALGLLGHQQSLAGAYLEAEATLREALAETELEHGPRSPQAAAARVALAVCLRFQGRDDEAEQHCLRAAQLRQELGLHPDPEHEHELAGRARARGDFAGAEQHAREAIRLRRATRVRSAHDVDTTFALATDLVGLADALAGLGHTADAEGVYREALMLYRQAGRRLIPKSIMCCTTSARRWIERW